MFARTAARPAPGRGALRIALIACVMSLPFAAHAETASDIVKEWNEQYKAWGATVARYGRIEPGLSERDVTLHDGEVVFSIPMPGQDGDAIDVRVTYGAMNLTGLTRSATGYTADSIAIPGDLTMEIELPGELFNSSASLADATSDEDAEAEDDEATDEDADGAENGGEATADPAADQPNVKMVIVQKGYEATGLAWPALPALPNDPQKPVTQYFPLAKLLLDVKADRMAAASIETRQTGIPGMDSSVRYENYVIRNQADGRIEENSIDRMVQTEMLPNFTGDGFQTVEMTLGRTVTRGTDLMPLLSLLGQGTDPSRKTLMAEQDAVDFRVKGDGFEVSIASLTAEDIGVSDTSPLKILPMLDAAALDQAPDEMEIGMAAMEAVGVFRFGKMEVNGVKVTAPEVNGELTRTTLRELSSKGFGEFSIDGLSGEVTAQGKLKLHRIAIADLEFPSLMALIEIGMIGGEPSFAQTLAARPLIGLFEIVGFNLNAATLGGEINIDEYRQTERGHINRIPTDIGLSMRGIRFPVSLIEEAEARSVFEAMNLTDVVIDQNLKVTWNEATGDLALEDLSVTLKDGGSFKMNFVLGNVSRALFETPEMAQLALAGATVKSAMVRSSDAKIVRAMLEKQAKDAKLSADTLAMGLADTAANDMGPLAATRFGKELVEALRVFLMDPKEIVIEIAPEKPVPVTQLIGMMASPNAIPDLLNARVRSK
ncbi:hypothetical protein [Pannonibacter carbonis]|uniref:hypothetical protein n=1 Tax=Pannonibacter carbonis TaxID=2067569 RepID=UPI000D0EB6C0|nr:hypothetical protein [Pannonibacter carbonis]